MMFSSSLPYFGVARPEFPELSGVMFNWNAFEWIVVTECLLVRLASCIVKLLRRLRLMLC